jgi:hypothetical protein
MITFVLREALEFLRLFLTAYFLFVFRLILFAIAATALLGGYGHFLDWLHIK